VRVALVVERFEPVRGGVESVVWHVARGLVEAGDEVHVLTRRGVEAPGVRLVPLPVSALWQPWRVLAFSRAAARAAAAGRYDVVHSFTRTLHQNVYRAGGGSHADYLARRGGAAWRRAARRLSPRHAVLLAIERRVFADPRQTIQCNSEMVRREIAARHGVPAGRLVVIWNGVDLVRFRPPAARPARAAPVWLLVGSGFARKGVDTALRALSTARSRDTQLWIAGRDAPREASALASRLGVAGRVRFLGERSDVEALHAEADALLLPTRYDAFANACLEAAASGLPVVTSGANGAAELLRDGALVVDDPEDVAGFARALDRLEDPALRARLGAAARSVAERHGWAQHVAELRALYTRVRE